MKVQNRKTKKIIDVPAEHAENVLIPQGWLPYTEPVQEVEAATQAILAPKKKRAVRRKAK